MNTKKDKQKGQGTRDKGQGHGHGHGQQRKEKQVKSKSKPCKMKKQAKRQKRLNGQVARGRRRGTTVERRGDERRGEEKNTRALSPSFSLRACARKASFDGCCLTLLVYEEHGCSLCGEAKGVSFSFCVLVGLTCVI